MTVWTSSKLGWSAGQDVSAAIRSFLNNQAKAGDTLVLQDTFSLTGSSMRLPNNFTLTAELGAGLNVRTTAADWSPLFIASNGVKIDNVTFNAISAPNTGVSGANPQAGTDYHRKRLIEVDGDNVTIENSSFKGNVAMFVDVQEGKNFTVKETRFEGGFYQVRLTGSADDALVERVHFLDSLGDGIKTESVKYGPQRVRVIESFFQGNNRDGIDVAGGFKDGKVIDSVFLGNGVSGIDIKSLYEVADDLLTQKQNTGIEITGSQFINSPNGVVVTVLDRGSILTTANASAIPHDIVVKNSIFENTRTNNGDNRAFLIKDGYDISWTGIKLLGNITELRFLNSDAPSSISGKNIGGDSTEGAARSLKPNQLWSYDVGPENGGESTNTGSVTSGGTSSTVVENEAKSTDNTSSVEADPVSTQKILFQRTALMKFDGTLDSVIELKGPAAMKVDAAAISFTFNANNVTDRMGLVTQDAKGLNGHFITYVNNSTLIARFQDNNQIESIHIGRLKANFDYDVLVEFGDGSVSLTVNGKLIGKKDFDFSLADTNEYLRIGANGWSAASGQKGSSDAFSGTIKDLKVAELGEGSSSPTTPATSDTGSTDVATDKTETSTDNVVTAPSGFSKLLSISGTKSFDGSDSKVIELAPSQILKTDAATIAFTFNASTVAGRHGLISKDASGVDVNDGHFTSYIQNGALVVRFQEGAEAAVLETQGIKVGTNYTIEASFGGGVVSLWVNGKLAGEQEFDFDWLDNREFLQIGANGWASKTGERGFTDTFKGTISNVAIVDADPTDVEVVHTTGLGILDLL